ncbi:alpha/beta fold hydrolase [Mycobacterium sp. KBS0706]|nr:hypothetical protein [Mycobacterium sp. KBS0706]
MSIDNGNLATMAELSPHPRLIVVPPSGYMTPIENPKAVTTALRDLLEDQ